MNAFDAVVTAVAILAIVVGFNSGLLRSLATILGYLIAAPMAVALTPRVMALAPGQGTPGQWTLTSNETWLVFFCLFVVIGVVVSALLRGAVGEFIGPEISLFDRVAGAALGAARIFLVAVLVVVIFDRLIPAGREPQFLLGSRLRPYLSAAGQRGMQSLPPEVEDYINRLKRERGI
jgi:membrane protein required for colicin V production